MRILFLSEYFHPHWTGLAKSILRAAIRLQERRHTCAVLTTKFDKSLPAVEVYKNIAIYRSLPLMQVSRTRYSANIVFRFVSMVKDYDLIFISCPNSNVLPFALIARLFGKQVVVFSHGDLILPKGWTNRIVEKIHDFSMRVSCVLAHSVSNYTHDYAQHSRILRHFMDKFDPLLLPAIDENEIDEEYDLRMKEIRKRNAAPYLIGFAGRFVEEKGFDVLLRAIHKIAVKRKDIHFVYAGSENIGYENFYERSKHLWERVNGHITKLGLLTGEPALNAFYKNLDLFVLPSRSDTFALVQAEAMGHGVPCIVTDIPGARWLVKTSGFGVIAEPENEDSLAEAILQALTRKEELSQRRSAAMKLLDTNTFYKQFSVIEARAQHRRTR